MIHDPRNKAARTLISEGVGAHLEPVELWHVGIGYEAAGAGHRRAVEGWRVRTWRFNAWHGQHGLGEQAARDLFDKWTSKEESTDV